MIDYLDRSCENLQSDSALSLTGKSTLKFWFVAQFPHSRFTGALIAYINATPTFKLKEERSH